MFSDFAYINTSVELEYPLFHVALPYIWQKKTVIKKKLNEEKHNHLGKRKGKNRSCELG